MKFMKQLFLEDLKDKTEQQVLEHIISNFEIKLEELNGIKLIAGYESVGNYGCDSSNWFLFERDGKLYEVNGSHCSCYGFEGQWKPEETTLEYLKSDKCPFYAGGYDNNAESNHKQMYEFLQTL